VLQGSANKGSSINVVFNNKFKPPIIPDTIVHRQRLTDILQLNIDLSVQVISSPAGYGKTLLLADFVNEINVPVCWYTLDEYDRDPEIFFHGLSRAIKYQFPDFNWQQEARSLSDGEVLSNTRKMVSSFVSALSAKITDYLIIVIEDYHFVEDSATFREAFDSLLKNLPSNCHIIISSRSSIELAELSRLIIQRKANCLDISRLSFTSSEVQGLFASNYNIDLKISEADRIVRETDGWVVALILKAQKLQSNIQVTDDSLLLSKENLFDFFDMEIFAKQTPEIQDFLLRSSTLDVIDPFICEHLTGVSGTASILNTILKRQLFIQYIEGEHGCYRYLQLFRDYLQQKLYRRDVSLYKKLHLQAAVQYVNRRQHIKAVSHFVAAGRYNEIVGLIVGVGDELLESGRWATLLNWVEALPYELYSSDRDVMLYHARSLIHLGESNKAITILGSLLEMARADSDWLFEARILSWRSAAYRLMGYQKEAKHDIKASTSLLKRNRGPELDLGNNYRRLGEILMKQGEFKQALKQLHNSLKYYTLVMNVNQLAEVHNSLGAAYRYLGQLDMANMHYEKARTFWQKMKNDGAAAMTLSNMAEIYFRKGDYDFAFLMLKTGLEKARKAEYSRMEACILIATAEVKRALGLYDEAISLYNQGLEVARQVLETYYIAWAKAGTAETYRLIGDYDKAETLIREAIALAEEHSHLCDIMQFKAQIGIIEYERGNYEAAKQVLHEAVESLEKIGDKDSLAKVVFHLAQTLFLNKEYNQAIIYLQKLVDMCNDLGYSNFISIEGRNAVPLLQYGASQDFGGEIFRKAIDKIRLFHNDTKLKATKETTAVDNSIKYDIGVVTLGKTQVRTYGVVNETQWRSSRAKELFIYLLCSETAQTREQIAAALWPELSPAKAASNFHINLYRARQALFPGVFTFKSGRYKINPEINIWFDVTEFEFKLKDVITNCDNREFIIHSLEQAIELYQGTFMSEFCSEWVLERRRSLEDRFIGALSSLAKMQIDEGHYDEAIENMLEIIKVDPFNDEAYGNIIEWQIKKGDGVSALTTYHRYMNSVVGELNCPPSVKIKLLHERVLKDRVHNKA
jgi:LuxR family maltose regulon positive regulatory protein